MVETNLHLISSIGRVIVVVKADVLIFESAIRRGKKITLDPTSLGL